ncbi:hypothetical protein EV294_10774 [Paenibacillus sp. BK033]|uniref:hypothetical protein n=1 Tax=Paenibacillus sp. BK033 TaxID=2512133 RepID=UPI0010DFFDAA|nr:hypothetical protein [Paenibacillus sp. BK033]TCM93123.1 hypothetical protein EV294_10774 [Paenibacillus sp. BK033]
MNEDSKYVEINGDKKTVWKMPPIEFGGVTRLQIRDLTTLMGDSDYQDKTDCGITLKQI